MLVTPKVSKVNLSLLGGGENSYVRMNNLSLSRKRVFLVACKIHKLARLWIAFIH